MTSMSQVFYNLRQNCKKQQNETTTFRKDGKREYCELIWDGIMCWPKTLAGTERAAPCPEYFGFSPNNSATRKCMENGQWYFNEHLNATWTNYTQCEKLYGPNTGVENITSQFANSNFIQWWFPKIKTLNHVCYGLSLTTLVIAMIIFICLKKLQCARNRLHMHLFVSFILKASMSLLKDFLFVEGVAMAADVVLYGQFKYIKEHNFWMCKAITSAWIYFIITTYMLILMEGIYLHNLIFSNLFSEKSGIIIYTALGWGLPVCFLIPWILLKVWYEDELCWTKPQNRYYQLFIHVPIVISTLVNLMLFLNILKVLVLKLNSIYIQQRKLKYRRLIRSTLILMPLFGVPYTISISTWYYATTNPIVELIWIIFDQTFTSLQGFFVAFIYCLLNKEVQNELKRRYLSKRNMMQMHRITNHGLPTTSLNRRPSVTLNSTERRLTT